MSTSPPVLNQVNLVVRDVAASVAFYRLLELPIEEIPRPEWARHHAKVEMPNAISLELDSIAFARQWNPGLKAAAGGSGCVLFLQVRSREEVDRLFATVVAHGYPGQKPPEDAFWGARYAIVEDPDGNAIGLMSPIDPARRREPPPPPS
jgi:uncharacterized glyoxalase superfamily protein PhnB